MFFSCTEEQTTVTTHSDLLGFKVMSLAESDEDLFDEIYIKTKNQQLQVEYINDVIYVSHYEILNACGRYRGDIVTANDTIFLKIKQISEEVCASENARRVTYLIDNPTTKKKIVIK
jgi:hypothetical protein